MADDTKVKFIKVPQEEPKDAANVTVLVANDNTAIEQACRRRPFSTTFRRTVIFVLSAVILYRLLCGFLMNHSKHHLQDSAIPSHSEHPSHVESPSVAIPCHHGIPNCRTDIPWEGQHEFLFNNEDIEGLILNIKGMASSYGNIFILQDSSVRDRINVTNRIFLSEDSLQQEVSVEVKMRDSDVTVSIITPSFSPRRKCVRIDTFITFPSNLNYFRSLSVDVPNNNIYVKQVSDIIFAYISVKSERDISTKHLRAETAEVTTVNGNIRGSYVVGDSLNVRNINGVIDVVAHAHPWAEHVSMEVRSVNGHIRTEVRDLTKKQTIDFGARSINGLIVSTMPSEFEGKFSVKTMIGYAQVEGEDLHFDTDTHNVKVGYKGRHDKDHHSDSRINLNAWNGAVELFFKERDTSGVIWDRKSE